MTAKTKTREQLQAEAEAALSALRAIEDREWMEKHKALEGKCFKYHNSYGGDRQRWWMYAKVQRVTARSDIAGFEFQTDCDGKIEIRLDHHIGPMPVEGSSWLPITLTEFKREWAKVQRKVAGFKP